MYSFEEIMFVFEEKLNRLGKRLTDITGTMYTAIFFALLASISLPAAIKSHDPIIIISWITQTFLQLVLLPIILVGQNQQTRKHDEVKYHLLHLHTKLDRLSRANDQTKAAKPKSNRK